MKKVLLTQPIPRGAAELLEGRAQVCVSPSPQEEVVREQLAGCAGVVVRTATHLGRETILAADALEVIARTGAGVDNVDLAAASERGIPVCHTPEANNTSVAEHTFALILALAKDLPRLDAAVHHGNWRERDAGRAFDLAGKTLGLVGLGRVGGEVARLAGAFRMAVVAYDPLVSCAPEGVQAEMVPAVTDVFERADVVSLHVPLTDETRGMVGADLLARMKPRAVLVNTSRGAVVDEAALVDALRSGRPAAAALDVFEAEPLPADSPLCALPNAVLTPHAAALTRECRLRMATQAVQGLLDVLEGRPPRWVANRDKLSERGYTV